jgi:anti-anti-sigma factor
MSENGSGSSGDSPLLSIESREEGEALVVSLKGEFDLASAQVVQDELGRARQSYSSVVLDLSRVSFMDSTGLHVVLGAEKEMREAGGSLSLVSGSPQVQRLLELTGAAEHLHTVAAAHPAR